MQTTPSAQGRCLIRIVVVLVFALFAGGCSTRQGTPSAGRKDGTTSSRVARGTNAPSASPGSKAAAAAEDRRAEAYARFASGYLHDLRDEDDKALEDFELAARSDPGQEGLILDVARRHLMAKNPDRAIQALEEGIKGGGSGTLCAFLASVYASLGRTQDAINSNLEAIKRSPSLLMGYHNLAHLYARQNQSQEAVKVLEQAMKVPNPSEAFLVELAELWLGFPEAKADLAELTRRRAGELLDRFMKVPNTPATLQQRAADAYLAIGQSARAIDLYLKLVEKYPQSTPLRERLADLFLQSRDSKRAIEQIQALIREEPSKYPQAYLILGSLALQDQKPKEAEDYLRKAVVLAPQFEPAYYDLAVAQVNGGKPRNALETLQDARARFSETFQTEFFSGVAYARLKEYSNAVSRFVAAEVIASARETNRLTPLFYFQLGSAYERNQSYDDAERAFRKSIALAPDFGEALNYLGYMWVERGVKLEEALHLIDKAVKLEPKNGAFLDSMAWVLFRLGRPKEALGWIEKAVEHTEEPDATLYDHLGDIHQAVGHAEAAKEAWRKSLKVESNPAIQRKLDGTAAPPSPAPKQP
jgi:tetratricopeptide (TPR) repeat protein